MIPLPPMPWDKGFWAWLALTIALGAIFFGIADWLGLLS